MGIVRFALGWPYTFYVLALLILFLGVTAFRLMPTDIFPEIDIPVVGVIWQYTGLGTEEMEQRVTTYSEYAMSTAVSGIKDIEAQTFDSIYPSRISPLTGTRRGSRPRDRANHLGDELHQVADAAWDSVAARRGVQRLQRPGAADQVKNR